MLVSKLTALVSSGVITEEIINISVEILQAKVTVQPSKAILILLNSALNSVNGLQITLLSEIVIIKQKLVVKLVETETTITEIQFSITELNELGEKTTVVEEASASTHDCHHRAKTDKSAAIDN